MGKPGHLLRKERAESRGGSVVAAEERGGRAKTNALRKGAGSARPPHACARPAFPSRKSGFQTAHPTPTVRTLEEEEPRGPTPPGPESRCASLEVASGHLFLSWEFRKQVTGTHFSPLALFVPLPHEDGVGGPGRVRQSPLRVFPPTLTLRASTARRFTPPGAPEPSAGTCSASPHSSSPTHFSPGMGSGSLDLFFRAPQAKQPLFCSFRDSNSDSPWQLEFSNKVAVRDYLMSPCARWCGRALSSSWKLPPRGARRTRPGGGERRGRIQPPTVPREGSATPPPPSPRRGEGNCEGEGRERGTETEGGSGFPPHPPPREQRVPAAAPCRPQRPAPRAPARPREGRPGRRSLWGRGNRSRNL